VASHHFGDRCGVWRTAGCRPDDLGYLAEVLGAEDAWAYDSKHLRVSLVIVVEAVDDSPTDAQHISRAYVGLCSVERPAQHPPSP
jgi:hypothetical protein